MNTVILFSMLSCFILILSFEAQLSYRHPSPRDPGISLHMLDTHLLNSTASYDVARNVCHALPNGHRVARAQAVAGDRWQAVGWADIVQHVPHRRQAGGAAGSHHRGEAVQVDPSVTLG